MEYLTMSKAQVLQGCGNRTYSDICDGNIYQDIVRSDYFREEGSYNLTTVINTDGIPIFKSSGFSIWPILLMINELPYNIRYT